jgi:hypothetical protein
MWRWVRWAHLERTLYYPLINNAKRLKRKAAGVLNKLFKNTYLLYLENTGYREEKTPYRATDKQVDNEKKN